MVGPIAGLDVKRKILPSLESDTGHPALSIVTILTDVTSMNAADVGNVLTVIMCLCDIMQLHTAGKKI